MVTNRANGSADQADGTTQQKTINCERTRLIWTETYNPVPQVDGIVRYWDTSLIDQYVSNSVHSDAKARWQFIPDDDDRQEHQSYDN